MVPNVSLNELMDYADWERQKWQEWLRQHGEQVLKISAGPHGDGRFSSVGDVVRHIFATEKRYIEWLSGQPLTDPASISSDNTEALFHFGQQSRKALKEFVESIPDAEWDVPKELKFPNATARVTPRKIVTHVVMHEIRHWAQVATLFRMEGLAVEFHDFVFSPVMSGETGSEPGKV
jgi:uncharacterized damage-inducible protein DinB